MRCPLLLLFVAVGLPAQAREGGRLEGRLLDPVGDPVPGGRVEVLRPTGEPIAATPTDGMGSFLVAVPFGRFELRGSVPGRGRGLAAVQSPVTVTPSCALRSVELALVHGADLRGVVVGADGRGVAGAVVVARSSAAPALALADAVTTTDAAGGYELRGVALGPQHLTVLAAGHEPGVVDMVVEAEARRDLRLLPGPPAELLVRVRDAEPELLAAARVRFAMSWGEERLRLPERLLSGRLDAGGSLSLCDQPARVVYSDLEVRLPGAGLVRHDAEAAGTTHVWSRRPGPVQQLRGTLSSPTGARIGVQELACVLPDGSWQPFATDNDGAFALPSPYCEGETIVLRALRPDLAIVPLHGTGGFGAVRAPFRANRSYELSIVYATGVTGRVLEADGAPARGVGVRLRGDRMLTTATTDGAGRYSLAQVPAAMSTALRVEAEGPGGKATSAEFTLDAAATAPDLRLRRPGGRVYGVVRDPEDRPVAGALVRLEALPAEADREARQRRHRAVRYGLCDREGRFVLVDVADGDYVFEASRTTLDLGERVARSGHARQVSIAAGVPVEVALQLR